MEREIDLPFPATPPPVEALAMIAPYEAGDLLDSSIVTTRNASGYALLTTLGLALCSPADGRVEGIEWSSLPPFPRRLIGRDQTIATTLPLNDDSELHVRLNGGFYLNLRAAQAQINRPIPGHKAAPDRPVDPRSRPKEDRPPRLVSVGSVTTEERSDTERTTGESAAGESTAGKSRASDSSTLVGVAAQASRPANVSPLAERPLVNRRQIGVALMAAAGFLVLAGIVVASFQTPDDIAAVEVNTIVSVGGITTVATACDPNYSGCVPLADTVVCADPSDANQGGTDRDTNSDADGDTNSDGKNDDTSSARGRADSDDTRSVQGPITVTGQDIHQLDDDGDGIACE